MPGSRIAFCRLLWNLANWCLQTHSLSLTWRPNKPNSAGITTGPSNGWLMFHPTIFSSFTSGAPELLDPDLTKVESSRSPGQLGGWWPLPALSGEEREWCSVSSISHTCFGQTSEDSEARNTACWVRIQLAGRDGALDTWRRGNETWRMEFFQPASPSHSDFCKPS